VQADRAEAKVETFVGECVAVAALALAGAVARGREPAVAGIVTSKLADMPSLIARSIEGGELEKRIHELEKALEQRERPA
jgi:hypothetical protein